MGVVKKVVQTMEKKSGILQSKFVRILLVVIAAAAGIVGIIGNNAGEIAESAGEKQLAKLQEMIGPNAEIVIAPGTYNEEIRILDGERGLFLAMDGTFAVFFYGYYGTKFHHPVTYFYTDVMELCSITTRLMLTRGWVTDFGRY